MSNTKNESIATLGTAIAINLAKGKDLDEINLIKNVCSQVSATLSTIIAQMIIDKNNQKK